jgi:hypothetical protein
VGNGIATQRRTKLTFERKKKDEEKRKKRKLRYPACGKKEMTLNKPRDGY